MPRNGPPPTEDAAGDSRDTAVAFPAGRASTPPNNLPLDLSSFVGRKGELAEVRRLLARRRLLTLTGSGGSGKTRLALAVAADLLEDYEDGVWLAELAPLSDPDLVARAVAAALGVREQPGRPLAQTLSEDIGSKKVFLVLDNCEHLLEACASLAEALLRSCPGLRILATSREALGVAGEGAWPVPPLSLPDPRRLPDVEGLTRYESVRLFAERAEAANPAFALTERNAVAVAQICYRLDGIPLALELAAARARALSAEQIATRLDDRFGLLTGGDRTALPHRRTLRAAMDWSHGLLSEGERALFRRLSAFSGGFTLGAVEAVCAGDDLGPGKVLDLMTGLVDKSLVLAAERDSEARYRLLETVGRYAAEKLEGSGETERIERRHALFFLKLAEEAEPHLQGQRQVAWMGQLAQEQDNFRTALFWMLGLQDKRSDERAELGLRLTVALWLFWSIYGSSEGYRWMEAALDQSSKRTIARARALNGAGWIALWGGDYHRALSLLEEGIALFKELGERDSAGISLAYLGMVALRQADEGRIESSREDAEALRQVPLARRTLSELLFFLAAVAVHKEDGGQAMAYFDASLAIFRELEDARGISRCIVSMGMVSVMTGDYERTEMLVGGSLVSVREVGDKPGANYSLLTAAALAGFRGEPAKAARLWGAAEALREAIGLSLGYQDHVNYGYDRRISAARSLIDDEAWEEAWSVGRGMTPEEAIEYALQRPEALGPDAPPDYPADLSGREVEVLALAAAGLTNARIAKELFISPRTVNAHLGSVYRKLGVGSRAAAARFASEHGLL